MKLKGISLFVLVVGVTGAVRLGTYFWEKSLLSNGAERSFNQVKIQQCPERWIDNQMPTTDKNKTQTQYFILNGARRELSEFDLVWIQKNCALEKQTVY